MQTVLSSIDCVSEMFQPEVHPFYGPKRFGFDFDGFLGLMTKYKVPATRIFMNFVPWLGLPLRNLIIPFPYSEGIGYDLSRWRDEYSEIVRNRLMALIDAGITPILSIRDDCSLTQQNEFDKHPIKRTKNRQKWGSDDVREGRWTSNKGLPKNQYMKWFWFPTVDRVLALLPPTYHGKLIWECVNEPLGPDWVLAVAEFLKQKGIPRSRIWASVTPKNAMKSFFEPKDWDDPQMISRLTGTLSMHSVGWKDEALEYMEPYVKSAGKRNVLLRPDTDGSKDADGVPIWKTAIHNVQIVEGGMKSVRWLIEKYGGIGYLLLADDKPHTLAEWKATWKTAGPFFKAVGGY